jgi:hypothetical protein
MRGKCSLPDCGLKDGLACDLGHIDLAECPHFKAVSNEVVDDNSGVLADDGSGQRLPWSGRALGMSDMMLVSARSVPHLAGLIGFFNAGKTSFLTSVFVHFAKSGIVNKHCFAGSYTLEGWERLKQPTEWPATNGPCFPPHTPDTAERVPSLLHLALREGVDFLEDVLFTDAPGEWFTQWVRNQLSDEARGARWIANHASHFLFFVDRAALAGPDVGKVRQNTLALARLLAEHKRDRPIDVIWAKSDLKPDEAVEKPVRAKLADFFGAHQSWNLHVQDSACLEVLAQILKRPIVTSAPSVPLTSLKRTSAFLSFTGT